MRVAGGEPPPHTAHSRTRSGFRCGSAKCSPTWNYRKRTNDSHFGLSTNTIYLLIDGSSGVPPPASSLTPNSRLIDSTSRGTPLSGSPAGTLDATGTNQRPSTPNGFARSCPSPVRSRFVLLAAWARALPLSLAPLHVPSRPPYRIRPRRAAGWHPGSLGPSCES